MESLFQPMLDALQCGTLQTTPFAVIDNQPQSGTIVRQSFQPETGRAQLTLELPGVFRDDLSFAFQGDQIRCRRQFRNLSGQTMHLDELGFRISGLDFGGIRRDDFFYHNENPRIYEVMAFPVDYKRTAQDAKDSDFDLDAGNRWADPGVVHERIGRSPYQPFPAIVVGNYKNSHGLVHGTLSQRIFFHNYLLRHENGTLIFEIFSGFKAVGYLDVAPNRILTDEWYLGATECAGEIEHVFGNYTKVLRKVLPPMYGASDINRKTMVWGSWNDGTRRNTSETEILREAAFLKKNFPTAGWIQLDDGYSRHQSISHGLGVPYEGENGIDHAKFPDGLRGLSDKIRAVGLRPALWIGGSAPFDSKIVQEKPEWFFDYTYRVDCFRPLDVSIPEVREYMLHALDVLIEEYGFEAVKHDFWSYAFEDSHDLLKNHDRSGYEYRDWWLKEIRKRIPADGYFQTGCDIVMGNPFLGEFFTNYRYGIDIDTGEWENVRTNYLWGMACFATHTGDLIVPNSDAIGLFNTLNDNEEMFAINYCIVTHSMVEIAGKLSLHTDSPRMPVLKKAVCNPNNGQDLYFARWDYRNPKEKYPAVLYFKTPHFSPAENQPGLPLRTVGLFNLEESAQTLDFTLEELALPGGKYRLTDVWSGEVFEMESAFSCEIPPHGSRLLAVSCAEAGQLLDADIRILASEKTGKTLKLFFDYGSAATLHFDLVPQSLVLNGKAVPWGGQAHTVKLDIPAAGVLEVLFA